MEFDLEKLKEANTDINTIKELGETSIPKKKNNEKGNIHCLTIIGQIEGHIILPPQTKTTKYEHIIPQIVEIHDNNEIDGVLIILNTVGGDVEAGLAISELISSMDKPTVSLVLGGGHSIGVPLAVSTDYSFIAPSATMTIHPVRVNGTVIGAPQTYDYFEKMQERILNFVTNNSRISKNKLKSLMLDTEQMARDVGTVVIGEDAVKEGLIDEMGGLKDAINKLYEMIKNNKKEKTKSKKKAESSQQSSK